VVQFDKEHLEQSGIAKIDLLGLRMLSAIADTLKLVEQGRGQLIDLHRLDFGDRRVYDQICSGQTIGLFQVESGAQVSVIPSMQPRCFQDLVVEISLIRPGPLQGNMVRPYLRRRNRQEPIAYPHPSLKAALQDTLGVIVFQEQVIKISRDFAGFAAGRGEVLRRALSHKNSHEELAKFRDEFVNGALAKGVSLKIAEQVWGMIEGFAGYSFSKAHAAAFAVIVYWSAWLRVYYPTEYFCGLLRNAPLGTYPPNVLESEARRIGMRFLPFDVNRSLNKATVERGAIRFGLDYVKGIGEERAEAIVQLRGEQPFTSLADFVGRTQLPRRPVEALTLAGAFDPFGERRQLLWDLAEAFQIASRSQEPQLWLDIPDERASLRPMTESQRLLRTFAVTGVTAGMHLVEVRRDAFTRAGCKTYRQVLKMRIGAPVRIGGLVADGVRRPPTAKGTAFLRLEEPEGIVDVIMSPEVFAASHAALHSAFLIVEGVIQRQGSSISVLARRIYPLAD
jgi:error-prone DNA polymerase